MLYGEPSTSTETGEPAVFIQRLSSEMQARWQYAYNHKRQYIEPRLFDCHQRRNGVYDHAKLAAISKMGGSTAYLKHTALKCRAAQSWIRDVLMPGKGQPWGIDPTPIPELTAEDENAIVQAVLQELAMIEMASGQPATPDMAREMAAQVRDETDSERLREAKERAHRMELKISDIFVEGMFIKALSDFIDDITTFPSAILKGPILERRKALVYGEGGQPMVENRISPVFRRVSPWDFYPSPECGAVDDGYLFERRRITRHELLKLRGVPGYNEAEIQAALTASNYTSGMDTAVEDNERAYLEGKDPDQAGGTEDDRCELVEYWGEAAGEWLLEWGMDESQVPDPYDDYQICAVMVNGRVIKAMLNPDPLGKRPYHVTSYEKRTGSIWGVAIPELMDSIQDIINSTVRNLQDNVAFAAGPQVMIDTSAIDPRQLPTITQIYPRKIHLFNGQDRMGANGKPIDFFQPAMHARELIDVMAKCEHLADDHTGIPAYAYGSDSVKGAGETMGGLSMLMNAAAKGIRQVIANIGLDVLTPTVEATFHFCMLYVDDPLIKGDAKVHARGALAQVIREQLAVNRNEFAGGMMQDPDVKALMGPEGVAKVLRPILESLELDDAIPSDDELRREIAARAQAQQLTPPTAPSQGAPQQAAPAVA